MKKTKLELTWPGKEERPRLEPRILLEHPDRGHHAAARREGDLFDNMLIKGDNLLALKALEQDYAGKVKCIYIDPPYNTGSAFAEYEDGIEHSLWLSLLRDRLVILHRLLSADGSLWVQLDDNEAHYLKVILDELFGRSNFVANIIWNKSYAVRSNALNFSTAHEHILVYAKSMSSLALNKFGRSAEQEARYANPDNDPRGPWQSVTMTISLVGGARGRQYAKTGKSDNIFEVTSPSGKVMLPPANRCWSRNPKGFQSLDEDNRIWWGAKGDGAPRLKQFLAEAEEGILPTTLWADGERFGLNQQGIREIRALQVPDFPTPKPERLIATVLELASNPGDLVLDSFGGSGTTGAVAHKMGRKWIMVEIGNHADTHIIPRLTKVIDGQDPGGVTEAAKWTGGGGFRYFTLAPSLLERDAYDNWVIAPEYNGPMLAEAMCKHLGFTYDPAQDGDADQGGAEWWRHGRSSERDFLYVTTQALTQDALRLLSEEVGPDRSLLICARAFSGNIDGFENLTCRKIPASILTKCEWGRDDYSLQITALPDRVAEHDTPDAGPLFAGAPSND